MALIAALAGVASNALSIEASLAAGLPIWVVCFTTIMPLSFLIIPSLVRIKGWLQGPSLYFVVTLLGTLLLIGLTAGGTVATSLIYIAAFPAFTSIVMGYRRGLMAAGVTIIILAGLYWFHPYLGPPAYELTHASVAMWNAFSLIILTIALMGALSVYHRALEKTSARLDTALQHARGAQQQLVRHRNHLARKVKARTQDLETKAKELEIALSREKELSQMQADFIAMASHEFRTPLTIIDGAVGRMRKYVERGEHDRLLDKADQIEKTVARLTALISQTLDAARYNEGQLQLQVLAYSPTDLLSAMVDDLRLTAPEHGIILKTEALPERMSGDQELIQRAVFNVIQNAVKFSNTGTTVMIRTERAGDEVCISVLDEGLGIPSDEVDRVMERFYRASTSTGRVGTGVGLFLSNNIVRAHGGRLTISSEEGSWTRVDIVLPIHTGPHEVSTQAA